ncbi:hypothetical protein CCP3SC1AL1_1280007 [Gammaproteobacteria bacterium]
MHYSFKKYFPGFRERFLHVRESM